MSAAAVIAIILSCHDGDTCRLDREVLPGRDRVRIANIDAPEIGAGADCLAERLLAALARDALAAHVGVTVRLEDVAADKYGIMQQSHLIVRTAGCLRPILRRPCWHHFQIRPLVFQVYGAQ